MLSSLLFLHILVVLPSIQVNQTGKRFLPGIHFNNSHTSYDFIHSTNSFICFPGCFESQLREDFAHPSLKESDIVYDTFHIINDTIILCYFGKERKKSKSPFQLDTKVQ